MFFKKNKQMTKIRQSAKHNMISSHIFKKINEKKISQFSKRQEKNIINTIVIDGVAYWIKDNAFYMAEILNSMPNFNDARPVTTDKMSREELDKMLFILDNLSRGDKNERGSSRN